MATADSTERLKRCYKCKQDLAPSEFHKSGYSKRGRRLQDRCKACQKEHSRRWYQQNRERIIPLQRRYKFIRKYGITPENYDAMHAAQGGLCAVCGRPERAYDRRHGVLRKLAVDHDHRTGKVRGLLCKSCNQGIGHFEDEPRRLRSAASYLEQFHTSLGENPA